MRLISSEAFVDNKKLITGKLAESDWEKVAAAAAALNRTRHPASTTTPRCRWPI